jgi:hypothetical protein
MAAKTGTYTLISSNTLGSATATVTFSSIPATYTDLKLVFAGVVSGGGDAFYVRLNSDGGSNYSSTELKADGTTVSSARYSNVTYMYGLGNGLSANQTNVIVEFNDYSNATTFKTGLFRYNDVNGYVAGTIGLWRSTSAINAISIHSLGGYATGSTFKLYGIEAGNL